MFIGLAFIIYILSAVFRLLDNSAAILLEQGISVAPFYLSEKKIKKNMTKIDDEKIIAKLKRNLFYSKTAKALIFLSILIFCIGIIEEVRNPYIIKYFFP